MSLKLRLLYRQTVILCSKLSLFALRLELFSLRLNLFGLRTELLRLQLKLFWPRERFSPFWVELFFSFEEPVDRFLILSGHAPSDIKLSVNLKGLF